MTGQRIAVVGMACRYPDAQSPEQLWENVLAGRRSFRRLPDERMRQDDYYSPDPAAADRFYSPMAAVIEGWEFDRVRYRVAGSTYRSTDLTHWLALDTAAAALTDAGFPDGAGLNRAATGVIVGNTLTGEFTRANVLRLRWPYVRRTVGAALRELDWTDERLTGFLAELEIRYKRPFPEIDEDTLAGGLANTIAGRICGHFDLGGGGFIVDGACSSSLLSVATACDALATGRLDTAVAGGVDLSIDPFEVIGFAKTGALATGDMRVYDRRSNGFWPGEGCGMLVLMRDEDAIAQGRRRHATIAGWGISSDGKGGITRPEAEGHRLAIERAYRTAGFDIGSVSYLEGHGTGTAVGDDTELQALSAARRAAAPGAAPVAIGTVKGNIGHTKAASGVAGLIKTVLAVRHQVIPPGTSHVDPHPRLLGDRPALRVPATAEPWPANEPLRAGVSSMGFGGINAHIVVAGPGRAAGAELDAATLTLTRSRQDCELLVLDAPSLAGLRGTVAGLATLASTLSFAEIGDLAETLRRQLSGGPVRAAVVAREPDEARRRFEILLSLLDGGAQAAVNTRDGVFLGRTGSAPRVGFLFPGQGSAGSVDGGALRQRFTHVDDLYRAHPLPAGGDVVATAIAQPAIARSSAAGLRILADLGIEGRVAAGHSLGELTALHWAGAMDEQTLLRTAAARGDIMARTARSGGAMAGIAAPASAVAPLLTGVDRVAIAGYNGPRQTVVSGPGHLVDRVCGLAAERGLTATRIPVSQAFHSDLVAPAAEALRAHLRSETFAPLGRPVVSTVTGAPLPSGADLVAHLADQVRAPVRFADAVQRLAGDVDLLLEVGPGRALRGLVADIAPTVPVVSLDVDGASLSGLLHAVGTAYVLGADIRLDALFEDRFTRPLPLDKKFRFFASPVESAPEDPVVEPLPRPAPAAPPVTTGAGTSLDVLRRLAADRSELPVDAVGADSRPLEDLHLSSITVGQIMNSAAQHLGRRPPATTTTFATATLTELADLLDQLDTPDDDRDRAVPSVPGVAPWVRAFTVDLAPAPQPARTAARVDGDWQLLAADPATPGARLRDALRSARLGNGLLLCLPEDTDERQVPIMLAAARAALDLREPARFVVTGGRRGAAALARTLHLEAPAITTTVVTVPADWADLVDRIVDDVAATTGFREVDHTEPGHRRVPVLRPWTPGGGRADAPLGPDDVLLATGGGKGITAECALAMARDSGASVGVLGRADPETDARLAESLDRIAAAGVRVHYVRADVTVAAEVKDAVAEIRQALGPVTAVLHGAGHNEPQSIGRLDAEAFRRTLAPKISGLEAVLLAADPASLRLLVTFGSVIGRAGLRGEAHYATANDWLADLTRRIAEDHPHCRCVTLEWSVWSGTGMGERLGVLETLVRDGISPIAVDDGIAVLNQVLADPAAPVRLVVTGRADALPTIDLDRPELPLARFLERPLVHYPHIELIAEADLSITADPYLSDHRLAGDALLPAVLGLEAMAQAATAVTGRTDPPTLEQVEFLRPIVATSGTTTIRVAVLADPAGAVRAVVRSSETGFQADHFRAVLRFGGPAAEPVPPPVDRPLLPLDPDADLYGTILFQGNRFRRLRGYRELSATSCTAELSAPANDTWFSTVLPPELVLGDPGRRDAVMHAVQCCVPDAVLLPAGIEKLRPAGPAVGGPVVVRAVERFHDGDTYRYDVDVFDGDGVVVEQWRGLLLRAVRHSGTGGPWPPTLLGNYLERRAEALVGVALRAIVRPDSGTGRRDDTRAAVESALGATVLRHRPDGRPELPDGPAISATHGAGVTFVVIANGPGRVACDIEPVADTAPEDWGRLLGAQLELAELVAHERDEPLRVAATRVWGAVECLRKTGRAAVDTLTLAESPLADWVVFRCGTARIGSLVTALREVEPPVVLSVLGAED